MKMSVLAAASAAALLVSAVPTLAYADVDYSQGGFYLGAWGSSTIKGEINKASTCDVGRQKIDGPYDVATCTDHSLTVAKELAEGFTVSLALIGTDADKAWYASHRPANS